MKKLFWFIVLVVIIGGIIYVASMSSSAPNTSNSNMTNMPASSSQNQTATPAPVKTTGASVTVHIKNFAFSPAVVSVKSGTTVTWVNNDSVGHTVTFDSRNLISSGTIAPGQSFKTKFTALGNFTYSCSIHTTMRGAVTVTN